MNTRPSIRLHVLHLFDKGLVPVALVVLFLSLVIPGVSSGLINESVSPQPLAENHTSDKTEGFSLWTKPPLVAQTPTPAPTPTPVPTYTISPDKIQTGRTRDVTITTDTGDLSMVDPQPPPSGSGVVFQPVSGQTVQHPDSKTLVIRVSIDENADLGPVPITLITKATDGTTQVVGVVSLEITEFKPRRISRGPTPDDITEVDAMWNVLPYKLVKANFGRRTADSFYAIEVYIGNNSGFDLQIVGVGFDSTLGAPSELGPDGKPLRPIVDASGKPILDNHGNKLIPDLDEKTKIQKTGPDGKPLFKAYRSYQLPTSDHRLVRGVIEKDQLYGSRALTLNLIGGVGTLVSGFIPFFHRANPKANFSSFSSVLNGQLKEGFGIAAPDLTVSQLNRLENLVLHDGLTVLNNSEAKTIVFFPRHVVELSSEDRRRIDKGESMLPLIDKLGELIIVGKPMITFRNREIVATKPQSVVGPTPSGTPQLGAPSITSVQAPDNAPGNTVVINGTNFTNGSTVSFGGVASPKVTFLTSTQMNAEIPSGALTGKVTVTTPGGTAESPSKFTAQPIITSIEPKKALPGNPVTINGANLSEATSVNFGGVSVPQSSFTLREKAKIIVTVPAGAESGAILVNTPAGNATAPATEKFVAEPVLDPLTKKTGKTDDHITITGKNLDNAEVKFGNVTAEVLNPGSTSIEIKVPTNAASGPITVKTPGGEKKTEDFAFIPKPIISGILVDNGTVSESAFGKAGSTITITGLNFKNVSKVLVGDQEVTPSNKTDTQVTFAVPANAPSGAITITITTPGGDATTDKLTVVPKPSITGFSVSGTLSATASGKVGDTVVLVGQNLKDVTKLTFGTTDVIPTNKTDMQITFTVPVGAAAGAVTIKVTTPGGEASTDKFTVTQ